MRKSLDLVFALFSQQSFILFQPLLNVRAASGPNCPLFIFLQRRGKSEDTAREKNKAAPFYKGILVGWLARNYFCPILYPREEEEEKKKEKRRPS